MSSHYDVAKCHRATLKTAQKGKLAEPIKNYGHYAYWCKYGGGWKSKPCKHRN